MRKCTLRELVNAKDIVNSQWRFRLVVGGNGPKTTTGFVSLRKQKWATCECAFVECDKHPQCSFTVRFAWLTLLSQDCQLFFVFFPPWCVDHSWLRCCKSNNGVRCILTFLSMRVCAATERRTPVCEPAVKHILQVSTRQLPFIFILLCLRAMLNFGLCKRSHA